MKGFLVLCWLCHYLSFALGTLYPYGFQETTKDNIVSQSAVEAKNVTSDPFLAIQTKSGFIHVGKKGGSMFYVGVPEDQKTGRFGNDPSKPWGIWLQGGPGCASDFALINENGPLKLNADGKPYLNEYSWHKLLDMVWIDQPLGTGFSETGNACNFATSERDIAVNMQEFLEKFLYIHNEFTDRPFYILGESYAGHYIPAIAYHLSRFPIKGLNLQGIAIGNGWVDPSLQYPAYAKFAFAEGIIDASGYQISKMAFRKCVKLVEEKSMMGMIVCSAMVSAILGKLNPYDIRLQCQVPPLCYNETGVVSFLNSEAVQKKLGVHKEYVECSDKVHIMLSGDWDTQTKTKIVKLLEENYDVLIYNGVDDFICNWMGTEAWLNSMDWEYTSTFFDQQYTPWSLQGKAVGEYKKVKNLSFYKIFDSGHMVPMDQPAPSYEMIKNFIAKSTDKNQKTSQAYTIQI